MINFDTTLNSRGIPAKFQFSSAKQPSRGRLQPLHDGIRDPSTSRASAKRQPKRIRPPRGSTSAGGERAVDFGRELLLSFEQELHEDADAQDDFRALRARDGRSTHRIPDVSHREGRAQNLSFSPLTSPLPLGAGESASMSSGSNPLQSEDNSIIHPNFAAVQNVAKPVAQLDAHSVSSTSK